MARPGTNFNAAPDVAESFCRAWPRASAKRAGRALSTKHTLYADGGTVDFAGSNLPAWKREKLLELFADNPLARC